MATADKWKSRVLELFMTQRLASHSGSTAEAPSAALAAAAPRPAGPDARDCESVYARKPVLSAVSLTVQHRASKQGAPDFVSVMEVLHKRIVEFAQTTGTDIEHAPIESRLWCVCKMPHADGVLMISCDSCDNWYVMCALAVF